MNYKNALIKNKLESFIEKSDDKAISVIRYEIYNFLNLVSFINEDKIVEYFETRFPYLKEFINFDFINERLNNQSQCNIKDTFPELFEALEIFNKAFKKKPNGIQKAELWLYPFALNAGADSDLEALIYFASQGDFLIDSQVIKERWYDSICFDIAKRQSNNTSADIRKKAIDKTLTLLEASNAFKMFDNTIVRFFSFRDDEENFIDATFFRAVEWLEIRGFEPWVEGFATNFFDNLSIYDDRLNLVWYLFFWCRSDLALKKSNKFDLESYLNILIKGTDINNPWKIRDYNNNSHTLIDYLPIACTILFMWFRINPKNFDRQILEKAENFIFQSQLINGGWLEASNDTNASIITTCMAIHALSVAKPKGWNESVERAKKWLLSQQEDNGCWHISGGPTMMITVLVLDSIHLAFGNENVTFKPSRLESNENQQINQIGKNIFNIGNIGEANFYNSSEQNSDLQATNELIKQGFSKMEGLFSEVKSQINQTKEDLVQKIDNKNQEVIRAILEKIPEEKINYIAGLQQFIEQIQQTDKDLAEIILDETDLLLENLKANNTDFKALLEQQKQGNLQTRAKFEIGFPMNWCYIFKFEVEYGLNDLLKGFWKKANYWFPQNLRRNI